MRYSENSELTFREGGASAPRAARAARRARDEARDNEHGLGDRWLPSGSWCARALTAALALCRPALAQPASHRPVRTVYFMPQAGLCNQVQAIFSAASWAEHSHAELQLVRDAGAIGANGWPDDRSTRVRLHFDSLFSTPAFEWVDGFPGIDMRSLAALRVERNMASGMFPEDTLLYTGTPRQNCTVHWFREPATARMLFDDSWEEVGGGQVLCLVSMDLFSARGKLSLLPMYRALRPSPKIEQVLQDFRDRHHWAEFMWVCVHIRRQDLTLPVHGESRRAADVLPMSAYAERVSSTIDTTAAGSIAEVGEGARLRASKTRIFLATDDPDAEAFMRGHFEPGQVVTLDKRDWGRGSLAGLEAAATELFALSQCPVLVGTYHSTFSLTAWHMGGAYFYQVTPDGGTRS